MHVASNRRGVWQSRTGCSYTYARDHDAAIRTALLLDESERSPDIQITPASDDDEQCAGFVD